MLFEQFTQGPEMAEFKKLLFSVPFYLVSIATPILLQPSA